MSWPESDPYLHELRRKWDEGHYRQDADSVYGVDEAIDEAIEEIVKDDNRSLGQRELGEPETNTPFGSGFQPGGGIGITNPFSGLASPFPRFGAKTCRICRLSSQNDPCDECYSRFRRASQTPSETGSCVFCQEKSPSVICVPCTERVLRDGLGNGREEKE